MEFLGLKINIQLLPGIYRMGNESAIGKTRLGNIFEKMFNQDLPYYYYSYTDYKKGLRLRDILSLKSFDIVLIDRADLYISDYNFMEEIINFKDVIFLVDLKNIDGYWRFTKRCHVKIYEDRIEVY